MLSVDTGQHEAAKSIGMTNLTSLRRIVLPQAMRVIVPPIGNEFIALVKLTSLASVIQASAICCATRRTSTTPMRKVIELLIVAAFWYLVVVTLLSLGQSFWSGASGAASRSGVRR